MAQRVFATKLGKIVATVAGDKTNVPIVFLHGVFLDSSYWRFQQKDLSNEFFTVSIDMPRLSERRMEYQ